MTAQTSNERMAFTGNLGVVNLPPLILHPFAEASGPAKLLESSRASLAIQGLLPSGDATPEDLQRTLLEGRYSEIRMLFYVGKDVLRWVDQCMDSLERAGIALPANLKPQSFASLLIQHTPDAVSGKLQKWHVNDFKSIFSRGLGLNAIFADVPARMALSEEFVRNYFRYADQLFFGWQSQSVYAQLNPLQFQFELYSSGEYSRMLERAWE